MEGASASAIDISEFLSALTSSVAVADVVNLLGSIVGIGMGFILMWFAVRKATLIFTSALIGAKIERAWRAGDSDPADNYWQDENGYWHDYGRHWYYKD